MNDRVDFEDALAFIDGVAKANPTWADGDFDDDGELTFDDLLERPITSGRV